MALTMLSSLVESTFGYLSADLHQLPCWKRAAPVCARTPCMERPAVWRPLGCRLEFPDDR